MCSSDLRVDSIGCGDTLQRRDRKVLSKASVTPNSKQSKLCVEMVNFYEWMELPTDESFDDGLPRDRSLPTLKTKSPS